MGASFVTMSLPGHLSRDEVQKRFVEAQERDRYENGHQYSGGFGMARGLKFEGGPIFSNVTDAEKHLDDACIKWEEARAVRHKTLSGDEMWLIGALCAS